MNSDMTQGVSRRSFMRILGAASAAATSLPAFALQQPAAPAAGQQRARRGMADMGEMRKLPPDAVIISSNENPLGPAQSSLTAICNTASMGGRYHGEETMETVAVFNELFGLPKAGPGKPSYSALFPDRADRLIWR
jgi:histidinol-phosphate aminotransferase